MLPAGVVAPLLLLALPAARAAFLWRRSEIPILYYVDSTSHVLQGWWNQAGPLTWSWPFFQLPGSLYGALVHGGVDILYAPFIVHAVLSAAALLALYDGVRRCAGAGTAFLAGTLAASLPTFTRGICSGQPEPVALALYAGAAWTVLRATPAGEDARFRADLAAMALLGLALFARGEAGVFFSLYGAFALWRWRHRPRRLAFLALWGGFWLAARLPWYRARVGMTMTTNAADAAATWTARFFRLPRWFVQREFPFNLLAVGAWLGLLKHRALPASLRGEAAFPDGGEAVTPLAALGALLLACLGILWAMSIGNLFSLETERNLGAVLFLAMAPAASSLVVSAARFSRRVRAAGLAVLTAVLAWSWTTSLAQGPVLPERVWSARRLGWELRRVIRAGDEGGPGGLIVLEAAGREWPNVLVYSGAPDRFRLVPTVDVEWGAPRVWDGRGKVGLVAVETPGAEAELSRRLGPMRPAGVLGTYRLLRPVETP